MARRRETAGHRIMVMSVFAFIFLVFMGKIGVDWQSALLTLCDFALTSFVFLLPVLLYYFIGKRRIVSVKSGGIFGIIWGILCFLVTMLYSGGDFTAALFVGAESFSILSFGRWLPPSSIMQIEEDEE